MQTKAKESGAGARNSGASKGCFNGGGHGGQEGPSTLSLLIC
jgi:hypothetical protein